LEIINEILSSFNIHSIQAIQQINKNTWKLDHKYVLKKNTNINQLKKSILLSDLLLKEKISVPEYLQTCKGMSFVQIDDHYYVLMKKIKGNHFKPFEGNPYKNGVLVGGLLANLHTALKRISASFECYEVDYLKELEDYIIKNIKENEVQVSQDIINYCYDFNCLYNKLPRQLIHRDIHCENMLFTDGIFSGYLDFDLTEKNVRLYDICYLAVTLLVENYHDEHRFLLWCDVFHGILTGYNEISELAKDEISAIPYLFVYIEMTFAAFFVQNKQIDSSRSCITLAEWIYQNKDILPVL